MGEYYTDHGDQYAPTDEYLRRRLQTMDPEVFEHFIADVWETLGWETRVVGEPGDKGIDVIATGEHGDGRVLQLGRDAQPLEDTVHPAVLRVCHTHCRHELLDGGGADNRWLCHERSAGQTDDERTHVYTQTTGPKKSSYPVVNPAARDRVIRPAPRPGRRA